MFRHNSIFHFVVVNGDGLYTDSATRSFNRHKWFEEQGTDGGDMLNSCYDASNYPEWL